MTDHTHVGESAELHALGLLEPREEAELERHVASCPECLRRVGEAEEAAALLVTPLPRIEPSAALHERLQSAIAASASGVSAPRSAARRSIEPAPLAARADRLASRLATERVRRGRLAMWGAGITALAAVLVIALTVSLVQVGRLQGALRGDDIALIQLVHSHFDHVTMSSTGVTPLGAKVMYAKDGSWIYVVADRPLNGLEVVATVGGKRRDFGKADVRDGLTTLFVRRAGKPSDVTLVYNRVPLATANLNY